MDNYQKFIALSRYARHIDGEDRRETWEESVSRLIDFYADHVMEATGDTQTRAAINMLQPYIEDLKVMPSMRALMTAGPALDRDHVAAYNCAYIAVDDARAFDEAMYILMCG